MTWDEACYGYLPYKPKLNIDYNVYVTNSVMPDKIRNLIVDKVNEKYGIVSVDTDSVFYGGRMRAIKDIEKELDIMHGYYLTLPWEKTLNVKKIIHSGPCTIVIWGDNEKTIVRKSEDDPDDEYAAFCAAFCKRFFGSTSAVKKLIDKKTVPYRPTNEEKKDALNKGGR